MARTGIKEIVVILGVNGQDGSYLAENLVDQHYEVVGIGRQKNSRKDLSRQLAAYEKLDLLHASGVERNTAEADWNLRSSGWRKTMLNMVSNILGIG